MSDLKIVPFKKREPDKHDNQEVIRLLEEALENAKKGNYHSMAIVMINSEHEVLDCWHNGLFPYQMVGALESLKSDYIQACIERR
ncbi:hypothetical protein [Serratia fonticola]|uniref:hypothetical protein n=1 Tax=Serratia fonticola TaxID=47917 RepID=UPI00217CB6B9|nr:hypothetical protein [Serratia fonticola]CAI1683862.1 Uncharacterised protein [Serratia fonticola]